MPDPTVGQSGERPAPIKLPLPPGKVLVFDHVAGSAYVADGPGPWAEPTPRGQA